jgi:hypothetical protein
VVPEVLKKDNEEDPTAANRKKARCKLNQHRSLHKNKNETTQKQQAEKIRTSVVAIVGI